ncbi:MAG: V-type ATP synthase subunit D [Clostridiales bacterium]|nr:V-type ATP synthase subunit D [Clostridiales bacterium]
MAKTLAPTKGNLMAAKNTLRLSKQGYEMLDKKRNILIREMMSLIEEAKGVEARIETVFAEAYHALEAANIMSGMDRVQDLAHTSVIDESITINLRSVMGVEIPMISIDDSPLKPMYSFNSANSAFDEALARFVEVKKLTVKLAEIENSVYRLAVNIKKTQKRANALQNITIPAYEKMVKDIQNSLEEKDREEHSRLKIIKER